MPDSAPLVEQIAVAVRDIIANVTTANEYAVDVVEVVRPTRLGGFMPRHGLVVLYQDDWGKADGGSPFGVVRRTVVFEAHVYCKLPDGNTLPTDTWLNHAEASLEKALTADRKLGGLAQMLDMVPPDSFVTVDGAFEGRAVRFEVMYRHAANDPYTPA